jgi:hypothetical protein
MASGTDTKARRLRCRAASGAWAAAGAGIGGATNAKPNATEASSAGLNRQERCGRRSKLADRHTTEKTCGPARLILLSRAENEEKSQTPLLDRI